MTENAKQRLDKWLWFSRMAKTRALAVEMIANGYVRVNGTRTAQAAKRVGHGDVLTIALEHRVIVLEIKGCSLRRGPYSEASQLYRLIEGAFAPGPLKG